MELTGQIAALCVAGAVMVLVIRQGSPVMGLLLTLAIAAAALGALAGPVGELTAFFEELRLKSGISQELILPLYKSLGIAIVVRLGGGLCRDAGESALAASLETAGTVCALLTALPLMRAVVTMLLELMK